MTGEGGVFLKKEDAAGEAPAVALAPAPIPIPAAGGGRVFGLLGLLGG